jgi:hypothetical protein
MASVHQIREAIDTKLDKWEADATALEAQLGLTKEKAFERLETYKQRFSEALQKLKGEIAQSQQLGKEKKQELTGQLDHLQVQLALGKAEARDTYQSQKEKIQDGIASLKTGVEQEIGEVSENVIKEFVAAENALEAELEALAVQFELEKARLRGGFEEKKKELTEHITKFKTDLEEKRQKAGDKLTTFEDEFSSGLDQIKKAFSTLFS